MTHETSSQNKDVKAAAFNSTPLTPQINMDSTLVIKLFNRLIFSLSIFQCKVLPTIPSDSKQRYSSLRSTIPQINYLHFLDLHYGFYST